MPEYCWSCPDTVQTESMIPQRSQEIKKHVECNNSFCIDESRWGGKRSTNQLELSEQIRERLDWKKVWTERVRVCRLDIMYLGTDGPTCRRESPLENVTKVVSKQTPSAVLCLRTLTLVFRFVDGWKRLTENWLVGGIDGGDNRGYLE